MNAPRKKSLGKSKTGDLIDLEEGGGMNDDTPTLLVMEVPPTCDEELRNFHETLFGVMEQKNIQPRMISRSEVLSVQKTTPDIYVLPVFEGPEFDHLMSKGCKVIGPFVVDRCIKAETRLPKWTHPIYCLSMDRAVVCFTGLKKKQKSELSELVMRMGGIVSSDLHDKVNILIAKTCDNSSQKYFESAKMRIPVLREDWITDAWRAVTEDLSDGPVTTQKVFDAYRVPLFTGMVISVSGLNSSERANAGRLIEMGRGEFTPEMRQKTCTHLITEKNSGDKFKRAREWGSVSIVTLKWLMKSVEMGYVQKEAHYDPERVRASTPTKGAKPPDDLDFSMVAPAPSHALNYSTLSSGLNSSMNSTVRTIDVSVVKPSFIRSDSSRRMSSLDVTLEEGRVVDVMKAVDMSTMTGDEDFFEGIRFFLIGVTEVVDLWWKKLINWSGATRVGKAEMATHIVIAGGILDKAVLTFGKPVLSAEWVLACIKSKRILPHTDFLYSSSTNLNQSLITSVNGPLKKTPAKSSQIARPSTQSGRVPSQQPRITSQQTTTAASISSSSSSIFHSTSLRRSTLPPPSSSVGSTHIFRGITFKMGDAIMKDEEKDLTAMINEAGGSVVSSSSSAHYLLCTLLDYGSISSPSSHKTQDVVSLFWLYRCMDSSSLVSPSSHPLFRPLPACRDSHIFEGLIFSLVGFKYEQELMAYEVLLVQYGGTVAKSGGRKLSRGVTHTIAGAGTKEGGYSLLGGQRALDPSWIIECIIHDKILLEDDFHFKATPYSEYEGRKDDLWEWEKCEERRDESRGAMSTPKDATLVEKEGGMEGDHSDGLLDMGVFDGEEQEERLEITERMETSELADEHGEEDSMVREITDEMEGRGDGGDESMGDVSSPAIPPRTPSGRSVPFSSGSLHHQRLQMLRSAATPSSPSNRPIPALSSPSEFLHKNARPKIIIPGVEEYIEEISSPAGSEMDRSIDQLSASGVGRMLDGMVMKTGRREMMETPIRGTSQFDDMEHRGITSQLSSLPRRRHHSESSRGRREEGGGDRRDDTMDYGGSVLDSREEMEMEEDSPGDSMVVLNPEVERQRREVAQRIAATNLAMKKREEEERATTSQSGASGEKETSQPNEGPPVGGARSRRKRLNLTELGGTEPKRPPVVTPTGEKKPSLISPLPVIGWADTPIEYPKDDGDVDNSRFLDSPIKVPPTRREPTMPSSSKGKSTVADRSMTSRIGNRSVGGGEKPTVTPGKTLRARPAPPIDDRTQVVEGRDDVVGEKSAKKTKSTVAISRRGRGKENREKGKVFAFTSLDAQTKDQLMEAVRSLGGSVSHFDGFDAATTHVICGKLLRNEKNLGAMVSSSFILKPSYLIESAKAKKWITEEEHEWCNNLQDLKEEKDIRFVETILRWKRVIEGQKSTLLVEGREGKVGAFESWRAVVYAARAKGEPFVRLVKAGGGEALLKEDVEREEIEALQPTHILVDGTLTEPNAIWSLKEVRFLYLIGARVFSFEFLNKFMFTERITEEQYFLPEYKKMLDCK